jgi:hypothetical protein
MGQTVNPGSTFSDIADREYDFALSANVYALRFSYSGNSLERSFVGDVLALCEYHHACYDAMIGRTERA